MPDCSKGLHDTPSRSGSAGNRPVYRCRNCDTLENRINEGRQNLREIKRELRRKARELRSKRDKMNLILLTVIDICDQGSPKLNRRAIEEKVKNPAFMRENIDLANSIASLVDRYRDDMDIDSEAEE